MQKVVLAAHSKPQTPGTSTPSPTTTPGERRVAPRTATHRMFDAILLQAPGQPEIQIVSTDMSAQGMAFECSRLFREGERLAVKFRDAHGLVKLVFCRARYCRRGEQGRFHVGVEFTQGP